MLEGTDVRAVAGISRDDIEDFKVALAQRRGTKGQALTANTQPQRLRMLRMFFERIIEWDWPDAPMRNPIIGGAIPPRPEALPKFLDDRDAAKVMAAARAATDPRDRLVVEVLARTGLRASELCDLDADAVVRIGDGHWLRVPVKNSPPTSRPPAWPNSAAKPTPACSVTVSAPAPSNSTAAWMPPAKRAATSPPAPSSYPCSSANETTPNTTANQTEPPSSRTSSSEPNEIPLDNDHPYNAGSALAAS